MQDIVFYVATKQNYRFLYQQQRNPPFSMPRAKVLSVFYAGNKENVQKRERETYYLNMQKNKHFVLYITQESCMENSRKVFLMNNSGSAVQVPLLFRLSYGSAFRIGAFVCSSFLFPSLFLPRISLHCGCFCFFFFSILLGLV